MNIIIFQMINLLGLPCFAHENSQEEEGEGEMESSRRQRPTLTKIKINPII